MKKIPTIFRRDPDNPSRVLDERNPDCQWVFDGEGRPTRKYDGTAALVTNGVVLKRYDCKKGRTPPKDFIPADDPDATTGHWPGWVPVGNDGEFHWYRDAYAAYSAAHGGVPDGTYELLHPRFQGRDSSHINPEHADAPVFVKHGAEEVHPPAELTISSLREYFGAVDYEGIVWHHPDGRMAKVKARDFGISRV